jgi:hypothetical protein
MKSRRFRTFQEIREKGRSSQYWGLRTAVLVCAGCSHAGLQEGHCGPFRGVGRPEPLGDPPPHIFAFWQGAARLRCVPTVISWRAQDVEVAGVNGAGRGGGWSHVPDSSVPQGAALSGSRIVVCEHMFVLDWTATQRQTGSSPAPWDVALESDYRETSADRN